MALELLLTALACYLAGAVAGALTGFLPGARQVSSAAGAVGSALLASAAVAAFSAPPASAALPTSTPVGGFAVHTNPLAGLFLLLTGLLGIAISLYSCDYSLHLGGRWRRAALLCLLELAMAALVTVLIAANAFTFLVAWEAVSILTYGLVALEREHRDAPRAAFSMLALGEIGFVAVVVAFALIGAFVPGRDFAAVAREGVDPSIRNGAFLLFLFGFGAKAGLLPLQGWLPEAHPAAPSNVSALLSAVVVKLAVYGLVLSTVVLLGGRPPLWWGEVGLAMGVLTACYGVLFSLLEHDLKRALAYSTIENLGFLVSMLGAALVFVASGRPMLEALALVALGLHALNHALLKGTLFLGAGAVQVATGGRDVDTLGGLARRMRWTGAAFFVGAAGLAGIPPLNGFLSEWLGLQSLLQSHLLSDAGARITMAASGALLALTFALAVTTFTRMFAGIFLGVPRSAAAQAAREAPPLMVGAMQLPAAVSVVLGLLPPLGIGAAAAAASAATGVGGVLPAVLPPVFVHPERFGTLVRLGGTVLQGLVPASGLVVVPTDVGFASVAPTYIAISLGLVIGIVALALRLLGAPEPRQASVWVGAVPEHRPTMQYTATAFTNLLRFVFGSVYRSRRDIQGEYGQAPFFARSISYAHRVVEPVETYIYRPVARTLQLLSERAGVFQAGNVNLYLLYLFVVFVIVLLWR
jgi:hydrogenase-4 component B